MTRPKQCPNCGAGIDRDLLGDGTCHACGEPLTGMDDHEAYEDLDENDE